MENIDEGKLLEDIKTLESDMLVTRDLREEAMSVLIIRQTKLLDTMSKLMKLHNIYYSVQESKQKKPAKEERKDNIASPSKIEVVP